MSHVRPILLVEDNPDDVALTLRAFARSHLHNPIDVACDGVEALAYLFGDENIPPREPEAMPQVILLDLKLPRIDGLEVLRRIRNTEATKRLPVVVLTSSLEEQDLIRSYDLGASSYVRKPVAFDDFVEAARQLGLYWLLLNRTAPT
jgi:two-component system, response regulator